MAPRPRTWRSADLADRRPASCTSANIMVSTLGPRWRTALVAAVGNWGLDYLALVAAIYAVTGAKPKLSLDPAGLRGGGRAVDDPDHPGGLGFVELGLTAALVAAGIKPADALLATLAYRVVSYWLPLPAGCVATTPVPTPVRAADPRASDQRHSLTRTSPAGRRGWRS